MTFDVSQLKSISNSTLSTLAAKETTRSNYNDERFWTPTRDSAGNARAIIRILPSIRQGELPWAEQWSYAIKGPGGWYIETSRRTINQPDPMAEYIAERWRSAQTESDKAALRTAGLSKARHTYIANILVVNDPEHPENNGQVRLWRFGQKIYEMITDKAKPDPFDETNGGINVTDWDAGCNFKLIVYTVDKFPRYDKSSFAEQSAIGNDEQIVAIADKMYDLGEFTSADKVKSYDELKSRVDRVFGLTTNRNESEAVPTAFVSQSAPSMTSSASVVKPVITPNPSTTPKQPTVSSSPNEQQVPWSADDIDFDSLLKDL